RMRRNEVGRGGDGGAIVLRGADDKVARDLVLDVLLLPAGDVAVPDATRARRRVELERNALDLLVELNRAVEAPPSAEDVLVGVAGFEARADVGVVADARFEVMLGRIDHRDPEWRAVRELRRGVDLRLHAREIA